MAGNKTLILNKIKSDPIESLRILDEEDLNLGSVKTVFPNPNPGLGMEERLIDVQCPGRHGEFVTVSFNILPTNSDVNDQTNYSGPIVGIVEFGNGSALNRVEIDVPCGNDPTSAFIGGVYPSDWLGIAGAVPPGGTAISVPGSAVRVYARHDGNGRVYDPTFPISLNLFPANVQAHVSYGIRSPAENHNYRTMMASNFSGSVQPGNANYIGVPPFAKSVFFYRTSLQEVTVNLISRQLNGSIAPLPGIPISTYTLAAGVNNLDPIPLSGLVDLIQVVNTTDPGPIIAVFAIGL